MLANVITSVIKCYDDVTAHTTMTPHGNCVLMSRHTFPEVSLCHVNMTSVFNVWEFLIRCGLWGSARCLRIQNKRNAFHDKRGTNVFKLGSKARFRTATTLSWVEIGSNKIALSSSSSGSLPDSTSTFQLILSQGTCSENLSLRAKLSSAQRMLLIYMLEAVWPDDQLMFPEQIHSALSHSE